MLELLHLGGRSLPHAVLMMIPEAWENHRDMDPQRRAFYEFHSTLMEPWDGPACVVFTDGTQIGAVLDRNGLRPSRFWVTDDGLVVLASEVGVLDLDPAKVVRKGRLQPGRMFLVDTEEHRIVEDDEIKSQLAAEHPYGEWLHAGMIQLDDIEDVPGPPRVVSRRPLQYGRPEEEAVVRHRGGHDRLAGDRDLDRGHLGSGVPQGAREAVGVDQPRLAVAARVDAEVDAALVQHRHGELLGAAPELGVAVRRLLGADDDGADEGHGARRPRAAGRTSPRALSRRSPGPATPAAGRARSA